MLDTSPSHPALAYIPIDRRQAMQYGLDLPDRTQGAALFADISGFTPLTAALLKEYGPKRGAEELSRRLNLVFDALIREIDRHGGSVISFAGDALTAWFEGDDGCRACACGLALQPAMDVAARAVDRLFGGSAALLAMKAAVAAGPARRFQVGNPEIQLLDVLAGETLDRMAGAEKHANKGEVVVDGETTRRLGGALRVSEWRDATEMHPGYAILGGMNVSIHPRPWPAADGLAEQAVRPWLLGPVYDRLISGKKEFLAEIRPVSVLFLGFQGLDYDQDQQAGQKLDGFVGWAQAVIRKYDGALLQVIMGDKGSYFYATFGAPLAHDDDVERAVAAAHALCTPPSGMEYIQKVSLGVSRGRMWTGAYGGETRRTYGVLGDPVNMAARLMGKAQSGQVLVMQDVAAATRRSFVYQRLGKTQVKGRAEPVEVSLLLGMRQAPVGAEPGLFPTFGRAKELDHMRALLEKASAGQGQILQVAGSMGIGKSHLARDLIHIAQGKGLQVCAGACQSITRGEAYAPWRAVLQELLLGTGEPSASSDGSLNTRQLLGLADELETIQPGWASLVPLLSELLGLPLPDNPTTASFDTRMRQEALFSLVVALVREHARRKPLLIVIEDVHWMDEASIGLTQRLGLSLEHLPVLVLLLQRSGASPSGSAPFPELERLAWYQQLEIGELDGADLPVLVAFCLGGQPSRLAQSLIQARAQGNPFFAIELVAALQEGSYIALTPDGVWDLSEELLAQLDAAGCLRKNLASGEWDLIPGDALSSISFGLPDSIHAAVLARLDRLPEEYKLTPKVACAIGLHFDVSLLARSHPSYPGREQIVEQLQLCEQQGLIASECTFPRLIYAFTHSIIWEAIHETLLGAQRRSLHRTVGLALERTQPTAAGQLAYHFVQAELDEKALVYLDKAARKAQHNYANETALGYYRQCLAIEPRWEWYCGQLEVLHLLGRRAEERQTLEAMQALPEAEADGSALDLAYLWGRYFEVTGDYAQAQMALEKALWLAQDQFDLLGQINSLSLLGLVARRQGKNDLAQDMYQQALALLDQMGDGSPEEVSILAQTLNGLGIVYRQLGKMEDARACYQRALDLAVLHASRRNEAEARNNLGTVDYLRQNYAEAQVHFKQALEIRQTIGDKPGEGVTLFNLASTFRNAGDYVQARHGLQAALAIQESTGNRWEQINILNEMGILHQELGQYALAQAYLNRALATSRAIQDESGQAYVLANLGLVLRDQGNLEAAQHSFIEGLALAQAQEDKYLQSCFHVYLANTGLRLGSLEQALSQAQIAFGFFEDMSAQYRKPDSLAVLAAVAQRGEDVWTASDIAANCMALLDECGGDGPEFPQEDAFLCYQVFQAAHQPDLARHALQVAQRLVQARAEKISDPDLRHSFLENVPTNRQVLEEFKHLAQ